MICLIFFIKLLSVSAGPATLKLGKNEVDIHRHEPPRPDKKKSVDVKKNQQVCVVIVCTSRSHQGSFEEHKGLGLFTRKFYLIFPKGSVNI